MIAGKRYPLVVQTHGFYESGFMTDGTGGAGFAARPLAAIGIVVLQIRDRLDHVVTLDEASGNILGYESAIEQLASDGLIDPRRVGIIGFSRTCYYVESALIKDPQRFAAAVKLARRAADSNIDSACIGGKRSCLDISPPYELITFCSLHSRELDGNSGAQCGLSVFYFDAIPRHFSDSIRASLRCLNLNKISLF